MKKSASKRQRQSSYLGVKAKRLRFTANKDETEHSGEEEHGGEEASTADVEEGERTVHASTLYEASDDELNSVRGGIIEGRGD